MQTKLMNTSEDITQEEIESDNITKKILKKGLFRGLLYSFLLISLIPLVIICYINFRNTYNSLRDEAVQKLVVVAKRKAHELEHIFGDIFTDLLVEKKRKLLASMLKDYRSSYEKIGRGPKEFVKSNEWVKLKEKYGGDISFFVESHDYLDFLLIDIEGNILYSYLQGKDLGSNIFSGNYSRSHLGRTCRKALNEGSTVFSDYEKYEPLDNAPTAFFVAIISEKNGNPTGFAALNLEPLILDEIMQADSGLGKTGETYLIGSDLRMRSNSVLDNHDSILGSPVETELTLRWRREFKEHASTHYADKKDIMEFTGRKGKKVLGLCDSIEIGGVPMAVITEMPVDEALSVATTQLKTSVFLLILTSIPVIFFAFFIARRITSPIEKLSKSARLVASGKFNHTIEVTSKNEIGGLASIFNDMVVRLKDIKEDIDYQDWLKSGRSMLLDRMRGEQDISELSANIITFIAEYINAQVGALYVNDNGVFRICGSYAYTNMDNLSNEFKLGEGLIGQVALEKQNIIITNVPDDYISVSSGLGTTIPRNIIVFPLQYSDGKVKGVIELGSINEFSEKTLEFLDHISESMAITLNTAQSRQQVDKLLETTLSQAEALQAQQEKLRKANEELEGQTRALKESEERLKSQQEELKQTNEELEEQTKVLEKQKEDMKQKNLELEEAGRLLEERAKEVEIASQYKSQFLANMSHELRTPLNSIILLSQLLSDNKEKNLSEQQVEYARSVQSSGYDLLKLINEILDLSKVESGKIELNIEEVSLNDIRNAIERNFKPVVNEKKIRFTVSADENLPKIIRSDRQRIEQVLKNLLSNAFKFTSRGGIELRISRPDRKTDLSCSGLRHDQCICFAVSDTGIGIPEEKLNVIFEAFQQADGTTNRKYGGTGLGLSISKELAGILGGEIQAVSREGKGSTFTLYLPETLTHELDIDHIAISGKKEDLFDTGIAENIEKTVDSSEFIPDDRNEISENDKTILIIEDDHMFAETLRDFSRERGFKAVVSQNGEIGFHFTETYKPSAIILDVGLPGLNGLTLLSRLKENNETRHIPVYFISGSDSSRDAMRMGAADFLIKPVKMKDLKKLFIKIEDIISRSSKNLLVIEDNPVTKKIIEKLFDGTEVRIVNVSTGREAMEKLETSAFDCVILDVSLPDMSGFEILSQIKNNNSWFASPIVVYTGKKLSTHERAILDEYTESIVVKGANSPVKLFDEVSLFLHLAESKLPEEKRKLLRDIHDKESILKEKKVLLTDDDMRNVFVLSNILEQKGIKVFVTKNGREALDCLRDNHDIDLVIMDMMMPVMDGYETIKEIRKQKSFANLPIIALTAKAMKGDRAKCIEVGASDYLSKPFEKDRLFSLLRAWLY